MRILILGGSSEASALAAALASLPMIEARLSLAGATARPLASPLERRIGGFGGAKGLADYLARERFDRLIDATHPFAARMTANAIQAARIAGVPLLRVTRPPWVSGPGDDWRALDDLEAAVQALGAAPRRAFLPLGKQSLGAFAAAPQHFYLVRAIDPPGEALAGLPNHHLTLGRGPFALADEIALLKRHGIETLVVKNAGGTASQAKLEAARALSLPVLMIAPPAPALAAATVHGIADALAWLGVAP